MTTRQTFTDREPTSAARPARATTAGRTLTAAIVVISSVRLLAALGLFDPQEPTIRPVLIPQITTEFDSFVPNDIQAWLDDQLANP